MATTVISKRHCAASTSLRGHDTGRLLALAKAFASVRREKVLDRKNKAASLVAIVFHCQCFEPIAAIVLSEKISFSKKTL